MNPDRVVIDDPPRHLQDLRSVTQRYWDGVVDSHRQHWPYIASDVMWGAHQRRGSAHELDPSPRWMRWDKVHDRILELMLPSRKAAP